MTLTRIFVLSVLVAAPAIASVPALAQQKAPAAAPAAQAPKAAPAAAKPKKAASPCQGLAETACNTNTACSWIVPNKSV